MAQRILVVGAGITGLATAVGLQRRGHRVTVIDQRPATSAGAGISIWPNALAALDDLGLGDAVRGAGGRVEGGAMRWRDGSWLRRPSPGRIADALGEPLVVLRRADLLALMTDALAPNTIEFGCFASELVRTSTGVRITLTDGTSREAEAVVGADGVGSMVARHLNGRLRRRYVGYTAWRGITRYALDADLAGETLGPGTQFGHVPLGSDHTYWFGTERRPEGSPSPDGDLAHLRRRYGAWASPIPALLAATDAADVLRDDLYDRERARRWCHGSVVIVGDAAHPMRPHLGQGGCQGLEDAAILARCVGAGEDVAGSFERYVALRRPRVDAMVREARLLGRIINARPALLGGAAMRASALVPESVLVKHLAAVAGRSAFPVSAGRWRSPPG